MGQTADDRTTPLGLFHYAHSYAASAEILGAARVEATHADAPVRYLFSHSIELYLKAFLLLKGNSIQRLRGSEFGHKIQKLALEAKVQGLGISSQHLEWLQMTDQTLRERYIEIGHRTVLLPQSLSDICESLHGMVGQEVYDHSGLVRKPRPYKNG